jgi:hypothetical protein
LAAVLALRRVAAEDRWWEDKMIGGRVESLAVVLIVAAREDVLR